MSSQAKRDSVAFAISRGHSERGACELIGISRSMLNYQSVRAERDAPVIAAMKRLAQQYPRYGYRRIRIFLRPDEVGVHGAGAEGDHADSQRAHLEHE